MSSLKISSVSLDKESWESVPRLLYNAFHVFSLNMANMKQWAEQMEAHNKASNEQHQELENRFRRIDTSIRATQEGVRGVQAEVAALSEEHRKDRDEMTPHVRHLLRSMQKLSRHLSRGKAGSEKHSDRVCSDADDIEKLSRDLDREVENVGAAFSDLSAWRTGTDSRLDATDTKINQFQAVSERTRERLLAWCSLQKENSYELDSLRVAIDALRRDYMETESTKLRHEHLEEAIQNQRAVLEEKHTQLRSVVDHLTEEVGEHIRTNNGIISEVQDTSQNRLEKLASHFAEQLRNNLDPISAYLNTVQVREDEMRFDISKLEQNVPVVASALEGLRSDLRSCDEKHSSISSTLNGTVGKLSTSLSTYSEKDEETNALVRSDVKELAETMTSHVDQLRAAHRRSASALGDLQCGEVKRIADELSFLQKKVEGWIQADPLPAKVSEARLYTIELALDREIEARYVLEEQLNIAETRDPKLSEDLKATTKHTVALQNCLRTLTGAPTTYTPRLQKTVKPKQGLSRLQIEMS